MIPLAAPIVTPAQKAAAMRVLESGSFILGDNVAAFEKEFAEYHDCKYGVGVSSGTNALHLSLLAAGVGSGDEVITVPNSFIATANAISFCGAKPVFVDIDAENFNISPKNLSEAITSKTRAILPVHLNGHPADMKPILEIAKERELKVIEDCCQAHSARYKGKRVGSFGLMGCFSFYPSKNMTVCGDGGMAVTNDKSIAKKLRALRNYGQDKRYHHLFIGFNSRLSEISAAIGREQLKELSGWTTSRRKNAEIYSSELSGTSLLLPKEAKWAEHVYHYYVVQSENRDALLNHLKANNIGVGIHYPTPIHLQPAFSFLKHKKGDFPIAEKCAQSIISLPCHPQLSTEEIKTICETIKEIC